MNTPNTEKDTFNQNVEGHREIPQQQQMNVDHLEIAKFHELADKWWDLNAEFAPLHHINPLRLNWIDQQVQGLADKKILDVGCGGGILSESMARRGADVLGVDLGEAAIAAATFHAEQQGITNIAYRQVAIEHLALEMPAQFDVVTCMEMLEHVPDPASIVQACQQLVKPGGIVVFSTLNRNPKSYLFAIVGAEYVLGILPRGTHQWNKFIKPSELAGFARNAGLKLTNSSGLHYNPVTKHYWLAPNVDVNYMIATKNTVTE